MVISTTASQVYLRLRVCMGDVQQDGSVPILPLRSVSKTTSGDDDVYPQVLSAVNGSPTLHLVLNFEPFQRARGCIERWLVLEHLRPTSGTDACVPGVHVNCIKAGAPYCHVLLEDTVAVATTSDSR